MGSTSSHTFKADLNGTGTLVDLVGYVDQNAGAQHTWGRTDWTQPDQPPGSLTIALTNNDGRFTPGSTSTYLVGIVKGMIVEWTCDARIRRFYLQTPTMSFDVVAGNSTVVLNCLDALSILQARTMQSMVVEATLAANPVAYWPLDDNASDANATLCREISGNTQASLYPLIKVTSVPAVRGIGDGTLVSFGAGRGPRTDGVAALVLNGSATTPIDMTTGTVTRGGLRNQLVGDNTTTPHPVANGDITIPDLQPNLAASNGNSYPASGWNVSTGTGFSYAVSFWFSLKDIYGPTGSSASPTDGPLVPLVTVTGPELGIYWRTADHKIVINSPYIQPFILSADSYAVSTVDVHHLAVTFHSFDPNAFSGTYATSPINVLGYLDGVALTAGVSATPGPFVKPDGVVVGTTIDYNPIRVGVQILYAFTGTISNISLHGPSALSTSNTPTFSAAATIWAVGSQGPLETAAARWSRIGGWLTSTPSIAFSAQGTAQPALLGPQATTGKSMLTNMCDALSGEEASFDTVTVAGVDTVRAWLDSTQRPLTAAITVDVDADADGVPTLSYDGSAIATTATAKGWSKQVKYVDKAAPARWAGTYAQVTSSYDDIANVALVAQYRTIKGRISKITPTTITIDAVTSKANLTASLLGLRPGVVVTVSGMPSTQIGYTSIDCILVGMSEQHTVGRSFYTMTLIPRTVEAYTDPLLGTEGPWRLLDPITWQYTVPGSAQPIQMTLLLGDAAGAQLSSGATTGYFHVNPATSFYGAAQQVFLTQDAADYPLYMQVDSEIIYLPNAASAPVASTYTYMTGASYPTMYQTVTGMVRGQQGTSAAAHGVASPTTTLNTDQQIVIVEPAEYAPLLAF